MSLTAFTACDGLAVKVSEAFLQQGDSVLDNSSVSLNLCLSGATHSDTTLLAFEVAPESREAGEEILVLCEFYLGTCGGGLCASGEDIED